MASKINWHRYGTKLRHCHPMYKSPVFIEVTLDWWPLNAQFTPPARHDKTVLSVSCLWIGRLLWTCSNFNFSVGDSLELSGIQVTPPKRTRHRQDSFVVCGVAVWISFYSWRNWVDRFSLVQLVRYERGFTCLVSRRPAPVTWMNMTDCRKNKNATRLYAG